MNFNDLISFGDFIEEVKDLHHINKQPLGTTIMEVVKAYSFDFFCEILESPLIIANSNGCHEIKKLIEILYDGENSEIFCDEVF